MKEYKQVYVVKVYTQEQLDSVKGYITQLWGPRKSSILDRVKLPCFVRISPGNVQDPVGYIDSDTVYYTVGEVPRVSTRTGPIVEAILTFEAWEEMVGQSGKKLVGYRLKKDTPMNTKGTMFPIPAGDSFGEEVNEECFSKKQMEDRPEWFEPVYAPETVFVKLKLSSGTCHSELWLEVTPKGFAITSEDITVSIDTVRKLYKLMLGVDTPEIGGFPVRFDNLAVGCKHNITSGHLDTLIREWEKVNSQKA